MIINWILLIIAWLASGVLTVAVAEKVGQTDFIDSEIGRVGTVVLWPVVVLILVLIGLGNLGRWMGRR